MQELIDELSYDLAECHVDYLDDAKLYTDYDTMAQKLISRGYRKQSEWISLEERLPENYKNVIVCDEYGFIGQAYHFEKGRFEWITDDSPVFVTHWMPLPEAPKGGAE